jgi:hypothetical protein
MRTSRAAFLLWIISLFAITVWGQGLTGSISGVVKDPNGGVVPGAKVVAKNAGTNAEVEARTDDTGFYRILNLVPADYIVSVEAPGFRRVTLSPQTLTIAQALRVDVNLEIGQVTETVTVTTSTGQINTEDAQLGQAITEIPNLPNLSGVNGRNPLNLASLMPGVSMSRPRANQRRRMTSGLSPSTASVRRRTIFCSMASTPMTWQSTFQMLSGRFRRMPWLSSASSRGP